MSLVPPFDDERTLVSGQDPGAATGRDAAPASTHNGLPVGTRLGEFEISAFIAEGGFGIVYLVYDHSLQRKVALKEYMPSSIAGRVEGVTVAVRSEHHAETFAVGLRSFINEARLLAQFDHPSLLKVYRFWEANGTGYFVMPYYDGSITVKQALRAEPASPSEAWLRNLLAQLLDALDVLHDAQCFHRDISPDNILLLKDGRPLLLDFGSARRVIGDMTRALTVFLKPGYAPIEQYAGEPALKQGPWTDLYALAAVVYFAIAGRPPMPSVARVLSDSMVPVTEAGAGRYSPAFLRAIDRALSVRPEDRPQSVGEFRRLLGLNESEQSQDAAADRLRAAEPEAPAVPDARPPRWRRRAVLGGTAVVVAIAGGAAWWGTAERNPIVPAIPKSAISAVPATIPAAVPGAADKAPASSPSSSPESGTSSGSAAVNPPIPERPYDPRTALADVYAARNPLHTVAVSVGKTRVNFNRGDAIGFSVTSSQPGFVYVLEAGVEADGKSSLLLLFPNAVDRNNRIDAGAPMALPRDTWPLIAGGPAGTDHFLVIVSDRERDFTALGMREIGRHGYGEFPRDVAARLYRTHTGATPPFAGNAKCPAGAQACPESFGAAAFSVEEVAR